MPDGNRSDVRHRFLFGTVAAALFAHVLVVALLVEAPRLLPVLVPPPPPPPDQPPTIEMVEDKSIAAGGSVPTPGAPVTSHDERQAGADASNSRDPAGAPLSTVAPTAPAANLATPVPEQPRPSPAAASATPERPQEQPEIALEPNEGGLGYGHQDAPDIVPASPDDRRANRMPAYPRGAGRRGEEGAVQMLLMIDANGAVSHVELAVSSGYPDLDRTATRAVSGWHFRPAMEHGRAVPTQMMQTFDFHILRPGEAAR